MSPTVEPSEIPSPTMDQLSGLLGAYLDSKNLEMLEDALWISAPYEVLIYGLREVARGDGFLQRPTASYFRFFILAEKTEQGAENTLDIVGFMDFKLVSGKIVPVHWQRGDLVEKLLSAVKTVGPDRLAQYTLKFVEVDPLHFSAVWLSPVTGADVDETLIPVSDDQDPSTLAEFPMKKVTGALVSLAQQRETREKEYYNRVAEAALEKLQAHEQGEKVPGEG